ncbi:MAG TPA: response regulator [bacterium]|jgi:CheY-like chemotaxis protein|nr:response regulator [bacterium]
MPKRILLVDDEDDVREVARLSLEVVAGWEVRTASSGTEALALAKAEPPDAILLDVMMPGVDGVTTAQRLAADPGTSGIPVLLLTAKAQTADRRRFEALPIKGVITKPFDPMQLARQVSQALGWAV